MGAEQAEVGSVSTVRSGAAPADWAVIVGGSLFVLLGTAYAAAMLGFALGIALGPWVVVVGGIGQVVFVVHCWRACGRGRRLAAVLLIVVGCWLLVAVLGVAASRVQDTSTDGRHYQGESVWALHDGWNPVRDGPLRFDGGAAVWSNSYPKAAWVLDASVLSVTNDFDSVKLVGGVVMIAAGLVAFGALFDAGLGWFPSAVVAGVLALSPVAMSELGTTMVDGIVASTTLAAIALGLLWVWRGNRVLVAVPLAVTVVLMVNAKFTGILFAALTVGGTVVVAGLAARTGARRIASMVLALAGIGLVAVVAFGFNPYVTNTFRHDSPLFPVLGPHSRTIDRQLLRGDFADQGPVERLATSLASRSGGQSGVAQLKLPFTFTKAEWSAFRSTGLRTGGFGPLFSGALLLAAAGLIAVLILERRRVAKMDARALGLLGAAGVALLTTLVTPVSFVARFAPQLWFVPCLVFAALLLTRWSIVRAIAWIGVAVLVVNAVGVAGSSLVWDVRDSNRQHTSLEHLRALPFPLDVELGVWSQAEARRLHDAGVGYRRVPRADCPRPLVLTVDGSLFQVDAATVARPVQGALVCGRQTP
jgi:hypothetical protein